MQKTALRYLVWSENERALNFRVRVDVYVELLCRQKFLTKLHVDFILFLVFMQLFVSSCILCRCK